MDVARTRRVSDTPSTCSPRPGHGQTACTSWGHLRVPFPAPQMWEHSPLRVELEEGGPLGHL